MSEAEKSISEEAIAKLNEDLAKLCHTPNFEKPLTWPYGDPDPKDPEEIRFFHMPRHMQLTFTVSPSDDVHHIDGDKGKKLIEFIRDRIKDPFLETFSVIEGGIEGIIELYFFGNWTSKSRMFNRLILQSDYNFGSKLRLFLHIAKELDFNGKDFEKKYRSLMEFRNAFTHGRFSTNGRTVTLHYFKSAPKSVTLNNAYFQKIKDCAEAAHDEVFEIQNQLRPPREGTGTT